MTGTVIEPEEEDRPEEVPPPPEVVIEDLTAQLAELNERIRAHLEGR
ncbi:hypothetical protein [Streptomyces litchfieldiae]|uniref:Uncharacterized protein n=1 Tax=Streptomyces litchfieldiae TaxID=3075543 RepID=A0ABU2MNT6_9ACTN|nr:hypothetical protein [Streptomyces sp. DSM 44938]MDT0343280.1 hypothetical protein [Streptomyces sp. DSM 44938]